MKIISWNLHGANVPANVPAKATIDQQREAWGYMRELGADIILAQEAEPEASSILRAEGWTVLDGELGRLRKTWKWGSVIASKPEWNLRLFEPALDDPWLSQLYDLVIVGELEAPDRPPLLLASVHTVASSVLDWKRDFATKLPFDDAEREAIRRPGSREEPYINDLAFTALARVIGNRAFIAAGDWNTCRKYAGGPEFFARMASAGWHECHQGAEERTFFGPKGGEYQLDHAFSDPGTGSLVKSCKVLVDETTRRLSDHVPLMLDLT